MNQLKTLVFPKKELVDTLSLKQKVNNYLEYNPNVKIENLRTIFPDAKPSVLAQYLYLFRRDCKLLQMGVIKWRLLKVVNDILKYKVVISGKLTQKEIDAIAYLDKLVAENYRGGKK